MNLEYAPIYFWELPNPAGAELETVYQSSHYSYYSPYAFFCFHVGGYSYPVDGKWITKPYSSRIHLGFCRKVLSIVELRLF